MTESRPATPAIGGVALLERAIGYTLGTLHMVTTAALSHRTPCPEWDVRALLVHMHDSLVALQEATDLGHVGPGPVTYHGDPAADLVGVLRDRAGQLLGAWAGADTGLVSVGGCPVSTSIVTSVGAVEIAVHGWDLAQACGQRRPLPDQLAEEMLWLCHLFVTETDRPERFAMPVAVPPHAGPGDQLLAFLGRSPG
jgi:uncharacterized protein (TIGR03086 family)